MKKLFPIAFLLLASPAWATTYYACATANINAANEFNTTAACNGDSKTFGTGGFPESGATLDSNAYTVTINVDPGPNGAVTLVNSNASNGFTVATSVTPLTLTLAAIGASGAGASAGVVLTITGNANANPALTIASSGSPAAIYGGSASNKNGVNDTHTVGTVVVYASATASASAIAYSNSGATGNVLAYGNGTGGADAGWKNTSTGTMTVNGNCIGSDTTAAGYGCAATGAGAITVVGSIINGAREVGVRGTIIYAPGTYGSTNSVKFNGGGTAIYMSLPPAATSILSSANFINKDDGTADPGTASAGGGGNNFISMLIGAGLLGLAVIRYRA